MQLTYMHASKISSIILGCLHADGVSCAAICRTSVDVLTWRLLCLALLSWNRHRVAFLYLTYIYLQVSGRSLLQAGKPCPFQTGSVPSGSVATSNIGSCTCNNGVYEKCSYVTSPFHVKIYLNTFGMLWSYKLYVSIMHINTFPGGVIDIPAIIHHSMSPEIY